MTNISEKATRAQKQAILWKYAARTLPFTALAALIFNYFIGHDQLINLAVLIITVTFFSISVFWWWWAVDNFVVLMNAMKRTDEHFTEVKEDLKGIKKELNDSNR
jgi:hypothetical protein